jgi:NTE family protein
VKLAVVLGAGGLVGVAHHVGVLRALEDEIGLSEPDVDLMVGTSAGSAIAAYLRSGWTTSELVDRASDLKSAAPGALADGPLDAFRRGVGSAYIVARTAVRVPSILSLPPLPFLRRAFPAGLATMGNGEGMLDRELPRTWPEKRLWLVAYDLVKRRRVVLGRRGEPYLALPAAVRASCAIPGVYAPVRGGGGVLVDGGAWSLTNVDLAAIGDCDEVICVAPMSYDPADPPSGGERVLREIATRSLGRSVERLRRQGRKVLVLSPGAREASVHGFNFMRSEGLEAVALAAYEETVKKLRKSPVAGELAGFGSLSKRVPQGQSFTATAAR